MVFRSRRLSSSLNNKRESQWKRILEASTTLEEQHFGGEPAKVNWGSILHTCFQWLTRRPKTKMSAQQRLLLKKQLTDKQNHKKQPPKRNATPGYIRPQTFRRTNPRRFRSRRKHRPAWALFLREKTAAVSIRGTDVEQPLGWKKEGFGSLRMFFLFLGKRDGIVCFFVVFLVVFWVMVWGLGCFV